MDRGKRPEPLRRVAHPQPNYPLDDFTPLLRSLLTWELVERVEYADGTHRWELTEAVERRLAELAPAQRTATTSLAYLDHSCAICRQQRLTHLLDGRFVCEECERHDLMASAAKGAGRATARRTLAIDWPATTGFAPTASAGLIGTSRPPRRPA